MGFGRDIRRDLFHTVTGYSAREVGQFGAPSLITRTTNDVTAGADAGGHGAHDDDRGAADDGDRHLLRRPRGRRAVDDPAGGDPGSRDLTRFDRVPDGAVVPGHAGPHRPGQPRAARADHRHASRAGLRARARGDRALLAGERRTDPDRAARRPPDGGDVPDGDADHQRLERRRDLDRRQRDRRRPDGDRLARRLPELPHADPVRRGDGHVHGVDDPSRRRRCRPHRRGARHAVDGPPARAAGHRGARARHARVPRRRVRLPGRRPTGAVRPVVPGRGGHHDGHHRQHRLRQDDARQPRVTAVRRHRGHRAGRRRRRARARPRPAVGQGRLRAAEAVPVLGHGRLEPALRPSRRRRRRAVGGARGRPGERLRAGHARRDRQPDHPGRHERVGRPAPAAVHRPGARGEAGDLRVRRLVLRARPRHRRPPAGGAETAHRRTRRC